MKIANVIVCVDYAAMLEKTLPHQMSLGFDEVVVVTTSDAAESIAVIKKHGAKLVISDRCYDDGHAFNRARMINDGLDAILDPDWVLLTDADIFCHPKTLDVIRGRRIYENNLYWVCRLGADVAPGPINTEPNGHFMLFNSGLQWILNAWPKVLCEEFCSTGGFDTWFVQQFNAENRILLSATIPCQHIEHGPFMGNWNGNAKRNPVWKQIGVINPDHAVITKSCENVKRLRLVDTALGQVAELVCGKDSLDSVLSSDGKEFFFKGTPIGHAHIHLSASEFTAEEAHVTESSGENPEEAIHSGRDAVNGAGSQIEQAPGDCGVSGSRIEQSDARTTGHGDCGCDYERREAGGAENVGEVLHGLVSGVPASNGRSDQG